MPLSQLEQQSRKKTLHGILEMWDTLQPQSEQEARAEFRARVRQEEALYSEQKQIINSVYNVTAQIIEPASVAIGTTAGTAAGAAAGAAFGKVARLMLSDMQSSELSQRKEIFRHDLAQALSDYRQEHGNTISRDECNFLIHDVIAGIKDSDDRTFCITQLPECLGEMLQSTKTSHEESHSIEINSVVEKHSQSPCPPMPTDLDLRNFNNKIEDLQSYVQEKMGFQQTTLSQISTQNKQLFEQHEELNASLKEVKDWMHNQTELKEAAQVESARYAAASSSAQFLYQLGALTHDTNLQKAGAVVMAGVQIFQGAAMMSANPVAGVANIAMGGMQIHSIFGGGGNKPSTEEVILKGVAKMMGALSQQMDSCFSELSKQVLGNFQALHDRLDLDFKSLSSQLSSCFRALSRQEERQFKILFSQLVEIKNAMNAGINNVLSHVTESISGVRYDIHNALQVQVAYLEEVKGLVQDSFLSDFTRDVSVILGSANKSTFFTKMRESEYRRNKFSGLPYWLATGLSSDALTGGYLFNRVDTTQRQMGLEPSVIFNLENRPPSTLIEYLASIYQWIRSDRDIDLSTAAKRIKQEVNQACLLSWNQTNVLQRIFQDREEIETASESSKIVNPELWIDGATAYLKLRTNLPQYFDEEQEEREHLQPLVYNGWLALALIRHLQLNWLTQEMIEDFLFEPIRQLGQSFEQALIDENIRVSQSIGIKTNVLKSSELQFRGSLLSWCASFDWASGKLRFRKNAIRSFIGTYLRYHLNYFAKKCAEFHHELTQDEAENREKIASLEKDALYGISLIEEEARFSQIGDSEHFVPVCSSLFDLFEINDEVILNVALPKFFQGIVEIPLIYLVMDHLQLRQINLTETKAFHFKHVDIHRAERDHYFHVYSEFDTTRDERFGYGDGWEKLRTLPTLNSINRSICTKLEFAQDNNQNPYFDTARHFEDLTRYFESRVQSIISEKISPIKIKQTFDEVKARLIQLAMLSKLIFSYDIRTTEAYSNLLRILHSQESNLRHAVAENDSSSILRNLNKFEQSSNVNSSSSHPDYCMQQKWKTESVTEYEHEHSPVKMYYRSEGDNFKPFPPHFDDTPRCHGWEQKPIEIVSHPVRKRSPMRSIYYRHKGDKFKHIPHLFQMNEVSQTPFDELPKRDWEQKPAEFVAFAKAVTSLSNTHQDRQDFTWKIQQLLSLFELLPEHLNQAHQQFIAMKANDQHQNAAAATM